MSGWLATIRHARRPAAPPGDFHAALTDHRRYERQIDRLHGRHVQTRRLNELREGEVSLASVASHRGEVARLLARTVAAGTYRFRPALLRTIRILGRRRVVHVYPLADLVVHGVVTQVVAEAVAPTLSRSLYSYTAGVPWWRAVSDLAAFVRAHRQARPDPRSRGLYVLRRDVDSYTDSIPVGPGSPLWRMLEETIARGFPGEIRPADRQLLADVVRPLIGSANGAPHHADRGVPTGQPVSCLLFNLYLRDLDAELSTIPGSFYARYSDDIVFAHADARVALEVASRIDERLTDLDLAANLAKSRDLYLTGAGRPSFDWPDATGTTQVRLLGLAVGAAGTIALDGPKVRGLARDLRRRAAAVRRTMATADLNERGRLVCRILAEALDPDAPASQQASAALLARAVTDRGQLAALDHLIARIAASAISGDPTIRAFRQVPVRRLRAWGLPSLLHARNTA